MRNPGLILCMGSCYPHLYIAFAHFMCFDNIWQCSHCERVSREHTQNSFLPPGPAQGLSWPLRNCTYQRSFGTFLEAKIFVLTDNTELFSFSSEIRSTMFSYSVMLDWLLSWHGISPIFMAMHARLQMGGVTFCWFSCDSLQFHFRLFIMLCCITHSLSAFFHIHDFTEAGDWLVSQWLTGERVNPSHPEGIPGSAL